MFKKIILGIAAFSIMVLGAQVALSFTSSGFTFTHTVTTSHGNTYYLDLHATSPSSGGGSKFQVQPRWAFFGSTDPDLDSDIHNNVTLKLKDLTSNTYIETTPHGNYHSTVVSGSAHPGTIAYYYEWLAPDVDPGNYQLEEFLNGQLVATLNLCYAGGSVTCPSTPAVAEFPTSSSSPSTPTVPTVPLAFTMQSLSAPSTTATIKGTLTATPDQTETLDEYVWPVGGTPQKIKTTSPILVTAAGFPITITASALQTNTRYNYKLVAVSSGAVLKQGTFKTNVSIDQSEELNPVDGKCGTAIESPQASKPSAEAQLCSAGIPGTVTATDTGWKWTCAGKEGGVDDACIADSLSSTNNGAICGSANGTSRSESNPPSAEAELCSSGIMVGTIIKDATTWKWTCDSVSSSDQVKCSATIAAAGSTSEDNKPMNFLQNPFKELDTFPKIIKAVVNNIILPIAVPFVGVMIIYSGFLFVVARKNGSVDTLKKAKQTLMYTLIGAVLILGSFVIANALQGTLNSIVSMRSLSDNHSHMV